MRKLKRIAAIALSFALALSLTACGSGASTVSETISSSKAAAYNSAGTLNLEMADGDSFSSNVSDGSYTTDNGSLSSLDIEGDAAAGRKVIYTADMTLEVEEGSYEDAVKQLRALVSSLGGYVSSSNAYSYDYSMSTYLTVRMPTEKYTEFVDSAGTCGKVTEFSEDSDDVTSTYTDISARLAVRQQEMERLQTLMDEADNISDVLEIEARISELQEDIESAQAQLNQLDDRADYSTINMTVTADIDYSTRYEEPTFGEKLKDAFGSGAEHIADFFGNIVLWLAEYAVVTVLGIVLVLAVIKLLVVICSKLFSGKDAGKKEKTPRRHGFGKQADNVPGVYAPAAPAAPESPAEEKRAPKE